MPKYGAQEALLVLALAVAMLEPAAAVACPRYSDELRSRAGLDDDDAPRISFPRGQEERKGDRHRQRPFLINTKLKLKLWLRSLLCANIDSVMTFVPAGSHDAGDFHSHFSIPIRS